MKVPTISHMQALALSLLVNKNECFGTALRDFLAGLGIAYEGPAFYQFMARMETAGLIAARDHDEMQGKQRIRQKAYKIKDAGILALKESREFYLKLESVIDSPP